MGKYDTNLSNIILKHMSTFKVIKREYVVRQAESYTWDGIEKLINKSHREGYEYMNSIVVADSVMLVFKRSSPHMFRTKISSDAW